MVTTDYQEDAFIEVSQP